MFWGVFFDGKLRWNTPDLYYFLTEIYVQSSAAAQRGTISEAGNLRRGGAEGSTTTSLAQNSPRVMDKVARHRTPVTLGLSEPFRLFP